MRAKRLSSTMRGPIHGRTGVPGITFYRAKNGRQIRTFFSAHTRRADGQVRNRKFCVETLGKEEAWRRALRERAEYVSRVEGGAK